MQEQLKDFRRHLRLAFIVPLLLAVVLGGVFAGETYYLRSSMKEVEHSYLVQTHSRTLLRLFLEMESGLRGYLLTGQEYFLQPYRDSASQVDPSLAELAKLTSNDPQQQNLIHKIEQTYHDWYRYSAEMIQMRQTGGPVNNVAINLQGKDLMDRIRADRDHLLQIEEQRLQNRINHSRTVVTATFAITMILSLVVGVMIATFSRRELATVATSFDLALRTAYSRTEELHQSQGWLSAVLVSIADGVIATNLKGRIIFTNGVARQILGVSEHEISRMNTRQAIRVVDEYSHERVPDPFEQVMATSEPFTTSTHILQVRPDGSEVPVMLSASTIRDEGGSVSGVVIVLRDMTLQRQSEQTLQSTEKLASIGRIAATVAHEIHNPLDALGNLLYLLEHSDSLTEINRNYVQLAREELDRVTSISEQMLTFSRETRQPVQVVLSDVLDNVLTLYEPRIRRMGVTVVKNYASKAAISAYPGEMRQVFSNLIGNALDAMNGPGRLTLHTEEANARQNAIQPGIRVTVCDTGSGVPFEVRRRLMEPFVTSKGEKGTGLGLWVCREIVEKYHGSLRYHTSTTPGRSGTCFSVFLPIAAEQMHRRGMAEQRVS